LVSLAPWLFIAALIQDFFREACYAMSKVRQCLPVVGFLRNSLEAAPTLKQRREDLGEDARRRRLFLRGEGWYQTSGSKITI